jgi:hypothetical protein
MYNQDGNYFTTKEEAVRAWNNRLDVQEIKHGKWELHYLFGREIAVCDCCKNFYRDTANDSEVWNYCPYCGSKIDGGLKND